jgi:phospholipase C
VLPIPPPYPSVNAINHIVVMVQENRSLDTYFGQLPAYWAANGFAPQQFDGMPANASNPSFDGTTTISTYHFASQYIENLSPS